MNDERAPARAPSQNHRTTSIFADGPVVRKSTGLEPIGPYVAAELQRVYQAMMLSPSVEVCDALLRGESVPPEQLDPEWVKRFGWKP
jgi:hypothetical protein